MRTHPPACLRMSLLSLALLAVVHPARADDDEDLRALVTPGGSVTAGAGFLNRDNRRYGQYLGLEDRGAFVLLDVLAARREEATGTWLRAEGRNLGTGSRDIRFDFLRQGDWGATLEFSETPRASQYLVRTRLAGIGTGTQAVGGEPAFREVQLETSRQAISLALQKRFAERFDYQVRFRTEEKSGSRLFGRSGGDFLAEPIDSTTSQVEASLGFLGKQLQLLAGYHGARYDNHISALYATGGGGAAFSPIALPPGNQGHQVHVSGRYAFTPATQANFKLAYGRATQDDLYIPAPAANPNLTRKDRLDGRIDTRLVQVGVASRPLPKLSLLANLRYEDRDDRTPVVRYGAAPAAGATFDGLYEPRSISTRFGKLEAAYQLPAGVRAIGGVERDSKDRYVPPGPLVTVAARERTTEDTVRVEFRRAMSEYVNGSVALVRADRGGSALLTSTGFISNLPTSNLVAPFHVSDRRRDKWRLSADVTPTESLSFQFMAENADDRYRGRTMGLRDGEARNYSADASYAINDHWQLTAYASRNRTEARQVTQTCTTTASSVCTVVGQVWSAQLSTTGDAGGIGVKGTLKSGLELGADLSHSRDRAGYGVRAVFPAGVTPPPDSHYAVTRQRLTARQAVNKALSARVEVSRERWSTDDWTWTNWTFADGSKVLQNPRQAVSFIGVTVQYRF